MNGITYENFDLDVEPAGPGRYRAAVQASPVGEAEGEFESPLAPGELEGFLLQIGQSRPEATLPVVSESAAGDRAKDIGQRLFGALAAGDVYTTLRRSMDAVDRQRAGLRLRLDLTRSPELADLPWEYMYDVENHHFLLLSKRTPLVRYLSRPERQPPLGVEPPLRILGLIASPSGHRPINVASQRKAMRAAVRQLERDRRVAIDVVEHAKLSDLQERLLRHEYHVIHFVGHGGFSPRAQQGALFFENEMGGSELVTGEDLGEVLQDQAPRLAILNACEGGRASVQQPFAGVAQSLIEHGVPAVIAMQFKITEWAAGVLYRAFYDALAAGYPVDAAVGEARRAVHTRVRTAEWAIPVLYMRSPDGHIFDLAEASTSGSAGLRAPVSPRAGGAPVAEPSPRIAPPSQTIDKAVAPTKVSVSTPASQAANPPDATGSLEALAEADAAAALDYLAQNLARGECILFLGAAVHAPPPQNSEYSYPDGERPLLGEELARDLAQKVQFRERFPDEDARNLARVSLYYETRRSRRQLGDALRAAVQTNKRPSPILRALAQLDFSLVITTNVDGLFEQALRDAGKDPFVSVYDRGQERTIDYPGSQPIPQRPFVFKMHGDIDRPESIVISDEDYLQFLLRMNDKDPFDPVPMTCRFLLKRWPTLLVGYSLLDYNLRLLFKTLRWKIDPAEMPDTYSLDRSPDPLILDVWQNRGRYVKFIVQDVWRFVPGIYRAVKGEPMPS